MNITPIPENRICIISTKTSADGGHQIVLARIDPYHIKALILKYDKKVSEAGTIEGIVFRHYWVSSTDTRTNHQESVMSLMFRVEHSLKTIYNTLPKINFILNSIEIDKDRYIHVLNSASKAPPKPTTKL